MACVEEWSFRFMTAVVHMTAIWSLNSVVKWWLRGHGGVRGSFWQDCDINMVCLSDMVFQYTPPARPCVSPLDKSFMSSAKCAFCKGDWNVNMEEEPTALGLALWCHPYVKSDWFGSVHRCIRLQHFRTECRGWMLLRSLLLVFIIQKHYK